LIAVGYMDPGNWATDLAGGSAFGYALLPTILVSSLVGMFLQWLALRLGIASGRDLAQLCRERFGRRTNLLLWAACEIAIAACDLAEVIGTAIGLNLLFGLPLLAGVAITALDTFIIMALERRGLRYIEALVITLTGVIGVCFAFELLCCLPDATGIAASFVPSLAIWHKSGALYLALGIFGATVMPHNLYLHSSIAQTRRAAMTPACKRETIFFSSLDSGTALLFAMLINAAILILAAAAFHASGHGDIAGIGDAYKLLTPMFGAGAALVFAVALVAAGQNSTLTGTMAGQITMAGFLGWSMGPVKRRLLTRGAALVPALAVAWYAGADGVDRLLVGSQVVLSLQLGFAVVPLAIFTGDPRIMGPFANRLAVRWLAYFLAAAIVAVNVWLVAQSLFA
jgi:manganese transport protein